MKHRIILSVIAIALLTPSAWGQTHRVTRTPQNTQQPTKGNTEEDYTIGYRLDEDLNPVENSKGKWGYVDKNGKEVLPFKWLSAGGFSEGLAEVQDTKEYWGYIDTTGKLVIPCKWWAAYPFSEGLAAVQNADGYGFIDKTGKLVIPCKWEFAKSFRDGLAEVTDKNDQSHMINRQGQIVK